MLSILLALVAVSDSTAASHRIRVAPAESLMVSMSGAGRPLVIVPGLLGSAFAFRHLVPPLVELGYRVVIVEPLGMGTSSRPDHGDYTLEAQAGRIAAVLDTLGIRDALLVAHALGGSIALRLALQRPDLVRAIVALEGGASESAATPGFRRAMQFLPWIKFLGGQGLIRKQLRKSLARSSADPTWVTDEVIAGYTEGHVRDLDGTLKAYLRMADARERTPLAPRLPELRPPLLLLLGAAPHDGGPREEEVARMRRSIPHFTLMTVASAGHHLQEEQPADVAALIGAFDAPRP
jgi:pimeloyl-ACP methyl ester carboxylesterase